jgi:16S rRNA (adenine1518-N6/adenine1519-N6)-dimethyltransferase
MRARRRFGQHFLESAWVEKVVNAVRPAPGDVILEIGPGRGALTLALAGRVRRVIAVEVDRDLAPALAVRVPGNVSVVTADFLDADVAALIAEDAPVRAVGNLPYNVSTPVLSRLLELAGDGLRITDATVMLQLEVAERLAARPGSKDWGVLSACQQLRARVDIVFTLPPGAFRPVPKVHSAVVRISYHPPSPPVHDVAVFDALVRSMFTQRRKMLANGLAPFAALRGRTADEILGSARLDGRRRAETLEVAELARLADLFVSG